MPWFPDGGRCVLLVPPARSFCRLSRPVPTSSSMDDAVEPNFTRILSSHTLRPHLLGVAVESSHYSVRCASSASVYTRFGKARPISWGSRKEVLLSCVYTRGKRFLAKDNIRIYASINAYAYIYAYMHANTRMWRMYCEPMKTLPGPGPTSGQGPTIVKLFNSVPGVQEIDKFEGIINLFPLILLFHQFQDGIG